MKTILFVAAAWVMLLNLSPQAWAKSWNCKATSSVECGNQGCSRNETNSVEITVGGKTASIAHHSVIAKDSKPVISARNGSTGFLILATAKAAGGAQVTLQAAGVIRKDKSFQALIDDVQYKGTCQ